MDCFQSAFGITSNLNKFAIALHVIILCLNDIQMGVEYLLDSLLLV